MKLQQIIKDEKGALTIIATLTPQNAKEKGYEYIDDIIYEDHNQSQTVNTILELTQKYGFRLGLPKNNCDYCYGLYAPIK